MWGAPEILPYEVSVFTILSIKNYKIGEQKKTVKNKKGLRRNSQARTGEDGQEKKMELEEKFKK